MAIARQVDVLVNLKGVDSNLAQTIEKEKLKADALTRAIKEMNAEKAKQATYNARLSIDPAFRNAEGAKKHAEENKKLAETIAKAKEESNKFNASINRLGSEATRVFAIGTGAIVGFVAAASPDAMATLTGSFQLLAGEIGIAFIPAIREVSGLVQNAARWFRGLDAGTKQNIASFALWTVGIAGGVMVSAKLYSAVVALYPAFTGLVGIVTTASSGLVAFAVANPVIAGIIAITAAVGLLTNGFGLLGESAVQSTARAEGAMERLRSGGRLTTADFERLPAALQTRIRSAPNDAARQQIVSSEAVTREASIAGLRRISEASQLALLQTRDSTLMFLGIPVTPMGSRGIRSATNQAATDRSALATAQIEALTLRGVQQSGIPQIGGSGPSLASSVQPQIFGDMGQFYDAVLMSGQRDDIQREIADGQARALTELQGINANSQSWAQSALAMAGFAALGAMGPD